MKKPGVQNPESGIDSEVAGDATDNPIDQGPKHSANGQTTAQLLQHLGKHYRPTPETAKEDFLRLMLSNPPLSANEATKVLGISWYTVAEWKAADDTWAMRYASALETTAAWHAARSLEVLDETQALVLLEDGKKASALAAVGREKAQGHRWHAAVSDRKRYSDKEIAGTVGPVNVVIALPQLQALPAQPTATARIIGQVQEQQALTDGSVLDSTA